ncbi:MAG: DUF1573 domain-containing protein [Bacteroides sp.]|nr:DUF1573 domain-containing protein [Bacteroides sp.]
MRIYKQLAGAAMMTAIVAAGVAADKKTQLVESVYDFGVIRETDGKITGHAHIVNISDAPTYIRDVRPSCGCTGAEYSTEPIAPGDTAEISFTYDPVGRPGTINKTVKVYIGDSDERHIVHLAGRVVGSPATLAWKYPVECGPLLLTDSVIDLGRINAGSGRHTFLRMINASMDTLRPEVLTQYPALSVDITPAVIEPGDMATLGIYFNTKFEQARGPVSYTIPIALQGDTASAARVTLRADILTQPADTTASPAAGA